MDFLGKFRDDSFYTIFEIVFLARKQKPVRSFWLPLLYILSGTIFLVVFGCESLPRPHDLVGAWKVDSTYTFYNGFDYLQREAGSDWATYVYDDAGLMKEIKYGSYQSYFYEWKAMDSLQISSTRGGAATVFAVLYLDREKLVLKKTKTPIFNGPAQQRYEIRYLSRTEMPSEAAIPFTDPRN